MAEDDLLRAFDQSHLPTAPQKELPKTKLPPVKAPEEGRLGSHKQRSSGEAAHMKQAMIHKAKELLAAAGTSIEQEANSSRKVQGGFGRNKATTAILKGQAQAGTPEFRKAHQVPTQANDPFLNTPTQTSGPSTKRLELEAQLEDDGPKRSKGPAKAKPGFFHYLGILAMVAMITGVLGLCYNFINNLLFKDPGPAPSEISIIEDDENNESDQVEEPKLVEISEDNPLINEAKATIADYFGANNKRYAYSFVVSNNSVSSAFNKYWTETPDFDAAFLMFSEAYTLPNGTHWVSFTYGIDKDRRRIHAYKSTGDTFKIDWQTLAEIESISLADLSKEVKTTPHTIRAWIKEGSYFPVKYSDRYWECYEAYSVDGTKINCYVAQNTLISDKIYQAKATRPQAHALGGQGGVYVKMMVRKPEIGSEYLEILDLVSTSWSESVDNLR